MKSTLLLITLFLSPLLLRAAAPTETDSPVRAAHVLVTRVMPAHANHITCEIIPADNGKNFF